MYLMKEKRKIRISTIVIFICAAVFMVSASFLIRYIMDTQKTEKNFGELRPPVGEDDEQLEAYEDLLPHYKELKERNADFVGWLHIYNTTIDYPVMQTVDDIDYYIRRNFDKEYDYSGSLFASDIAVIDPPSDLVLIYGHDMQSGAMFGTLKKWKEQAYWEEHKYFRFDTLTERRSYEICAVLQTVVDTGLADEFKYYNIATFRDEGTFNEFKENITSRWYYDPGVEMLFGDKYMIFSTCEDTNDDKRLLVLAKQIDNDDPDLQAAIAVEVEANSKKK